MINKYTNKQRGFLAVIMAMVMVFAGAAFVAAEVDATDDVYNVGPSDYADIPTAINQAVADGKTTFTIELKANVTGSGFTTVDGQNVTIDLKNFTYTISSSVGSAGTETSGMQLKKGSIVSIKNGTITSTDDATIGGKTPGPYGLKMLVQNYSNLTLYNVNLDGSNVQDGWYTASFNNCVVKIAGDSDIIAPTDGIAFDVYDYNKMYTTPATVTFESDYIGTIEGKVDIGADNGSARVPIVLNIESSIEIDEITSIGLIKIFEGAKLKTEKVLGGTIEVAGIFEATENNATTSAVKVSSGATVSGVAAKKIEYNAGTGQFEFGDTLNSDYTVTKDEYLSNNLTIPEGVTLTIADGGVLNMAGNNITVLGSFVVEIGGTLASVVGTETVFLVKGCTFDNSGMIGYGQSVNISAVTDEGAKYVGMGSVSMSGISGVEFDIVNTGEKNGDNEAIYILTVSGDFYTENDSATITLNDVRMVGETYIGDDIIVIADNVVLMGNATLTINGTLAENLVMENKSTVVMNGTLAGKITAQTGDYATKDGYTSASGVTEVTVNAGTANTNGITGFVLTIGTYAFTDKDGSTGPVAMTSQRLYISGDLDYVNIESETDATGEVLGIKGTAYVAESATLTLAKKMTINATNPIIVQGQIVADTDSVGTISAYVGTSYFVKTTTPKTSTLYIEPFDAAILNIDSADRKTLNVCEKVKINGALTLTEGQIIINNGEIKVSKTGNLVLEAKSKINNIAVASVEGILKVMKGASCDEPSNYATLVKNNEYVQYSGLQVALDSAVEGDTITIANETTVSKGDLVIPAGVTVIATEDITVSEGDVDVLGKLVLEDGAVLTVAGEDATIDVSGELDASEGDISITDGSLTSTGTTIVTTSSSLDVSDINGVCYINDDGNTVITSAQKAIDAEASKDVPSDVDVYGNVSADNLNIDADITVAADAVFKVGNAFISEGKKVNLTNGKTTGSFSASTGVEETTTGALTTSTISFTDAYGIVIGEGDVVDSMNVKTHVLYIYGNLKGKMTVDVGTATVGYGSDVGLVVKSAYTPYTAAYMEVADGATLDIADGMALTVGTVGEIEKTAAVVVKGTISVAGEITNEGILAIDGQMIVSDENELELDKNVELGGDLVISTTEDKEAVVTVKGVIFVASTGSIAGAIDIEDSATAYIQILDGADISAASINYDENDKESDALSTAFYINGDLYMTVYAIGNVTITSVLDATEFVVPGYVTDGMNDETKWFLTDKYDKTKMASDMTVVSKDVPAVYYKAVQAEVIGTISVGSGLTLYIDGLSIDNYKKTVESQTGYYLTVGTHTVTYDVLSGYDGSNAVITFNGAAVSGGSIVVNADAESFVLSINGAVPMANQPVVIEPADDEGMALTDILLIVLVVLIVIMAIIVALRMMRS